MKMTASAAKKFIDEILDSADSDTNDSPSESVFVDAGDDPATFDVFHEAYRYFSSLLLLLYCPSTFPSKTWWGSGNEYLGLSTELVR